jgi:hypothetical protein
MSTQQEIVVSDEMPARQVATTETAAIVQMIERAASNPAVDIDKMERLLEMQERVFARNAKGEYNAAFALMQQDLPTIAERGVGDKSMKYALWEDVNEAIRPVLAKHGFGLSFKTGRTPDRITVTAILMHRGGHAEETTLELPIDTSGSKNAVQAVGSSTSYGKRYTAQALLNLVSRDGIERDDDGQRSGGPVTITDEQATEIRGLVTKSGSDIQKFLAAFRSESIPDMLAKDYGQAVNMLNAKINARARA